MIRWLNKKIAVFHFVLIAAFVLFSLADIRASQREKELAKNIPLKILYVGQQGNTRYNDFVAFLKANFETVNTVDIKTFDEKQTKDSDVVILDSDGTKAALSIKLSKDYSKPTISMGIPGAHWNDEMRLKTGYS
jgi:hypothetical protein